jgi:hypothetical protein
MEANRHPTRGTTESPAKTSLFTGFSANAARRREPPCEELFKWE